MTFRSLFVVLLVLTSIAVAGARAQVTLPPDESKTIGAQVPDVMLIDEDSTMFALSTLVKKPIVINPVFTACRQTCPMITTSLRDALKEIGEPGEGYHVLTVSFDPADGPAQLREYRKNMELPAGWKLAVATPENLTRLFDAIDFNYEALPDGGFAHANVIAILTPVLTVSSYERGVSFETAVLRRDLERAAREASFVRHYRPVIGLAALAALTSVVVALYTTRKKKQQPA